MQHNNTSSRSLESKSLHASTHPPEVLTQLYASYRSLIYRINFCSKQRNPQTKYVVYFQVSPFRYYSLVSISFLALPLTVSSNSVLKIDPAFVELCLNFRQYEDQYPISSPFPTSPVVSGTATVPHRLADKYRYAWPDFYPSRAPCVYKSGPAWEVCKGPEEQGIVREPRTVCRPDVAPVWVSILQQIIACLVCDMTQNDPEKRLTVQGVGSPFAGIRQGLSIWKLRSRVVHRDRIWPLRILRSSGHLLRTAEYIITRKWQYLNLNHSFALCYFVATHHTVHAVHP